MIQRPAPRLPRPARNVTAVLMILAALSGCAVTNPRYPSLLPRAAETRGATEAVTAAPDLVADPAIEARAATLTADLREAAAAFDPLAVRATALAATAKTGGIGSDAWLAAQSSLAELDTLRARSLTTLAEIDRMTIDRGVAGLHAYPALESVRAEAEAQSARQTETIEKLQRQLPTG